MILTIFRTKDVSEMEDLRKPEFSHATSSLGKSSELGLSVLVKEKTDFFYIALTRALWRDFVGARARCGRQIHTYRIGFFCRNFRTKDVSKK